MTAFSYDEDGSSTIIFIIAALVLYLVPATFWRLSSNSDKPKLDVLKHQNTEFVELCKVKKVNRVTKEKSIWTRSNIIYAAAWILFFVMLWGAYNIRMAEVEVYNPYEILGLQIGASDRQIKKMYHQKSIANHPDKNPDDPLANDRYMEIVKAYQALTDPAIKENLEKYGHPDGRRAAQFGIALPSFIVSSTYKWPILGLYFLCFMVGLPLIVGTWWSQSTRYTREQILLDSIALYYQNLRPQTSMKDMVEILCASVEFRDNIPVRPEDSEELQKLIKVLVAKNPELEDYFTRTKYNADYCIKTKALMFAHLMRITDMTPAHRQDQGRILSMVPPLLAAMIKIAGMRLWLSLTVKIIHLNQYITQAMIDQPGAALVQLPNITEELYENTLMPKGITNLREVMELSPKQQSETFSSLAEQERHDALIVANNVPCIIADTEFKVIAEDDIYTNSMITVKLKLHRLHFNEMLQKVEELKEKHMKKNDPRRRPESKAKLSKGDVEVDWDPSLIKKEKVFHEKSHSFPVHCPYFPEDREEAWWVFIGDSPNAEDNLLTEPKRIDNLVDETELELYLPPVEKAGQYTYFLFIASENYCSSDVVQPLV
eukprot:Ihof_evm4s41 gene=Ihof_evmTU4s41